jgi:CRISPR-associated protein Cmr6
MAVSGCLREALSPEETNVSSFLKCGFVEKVREGLSSRRGGLEAEELSRELNKWRHDTASKLADRYSRGNIANLLERARKRVDEAVKALEELGYQVVVNKNYLTLTPLAIGLRNPYTEPLEIAIAWDPYMNLPYIPGSSLKGAVAALAYLRNSEWYTLLTSRTREPPAQPSPAAPQRASPVIFLDAYPVDVLAGSLLAVDIVNPHYREVEGRVSEPESSPTPLSFLVVPKGVAFRIVVCAAGRWLKSYKGKPSFSELETLIGQALSRGIGAKTSLGYGRFKPEH